MAEKWSLTPKYIASSLAMLIAPDSLREPDSLPFTAITVGDHYGAVIVFGVTQQEADARAAQILAATNRPHSKNTEVE